ncbi:hypothetical protein BDI4_290148 [Burkholderia diffusa]|nr:hypothetical protein BDI4_290148 [Burkholderia diffusa]
MEIFSVNEKVCFGKQRSQYSERTSFHYPCSTQTSIADVSIIAPGLLPPASECLSRSRNVHDTLYAVLSTFSACCAAAKP